MFACNVVNIHQHSDNAGSSECLPLPHPSLGTAPPRSFVIEKLNINSLNVIIWTFVLLNWMFYIGFYMNSV